MDQDKIAKALRERVDEMMLGGLGLRSPQSNTGVTTATPVAPLTLDTIKAAMDKMPPRETWLSSVNFPADTTLRLHTRRENWTAAHPSFWTRVMVQLARERHGGPAIPFGSLYDPRPINVDIAEGDSDHVRKYKERELKRYTDALEWRIRTDEMMKEMRVVLPGPGVVDLKASS